MPAADPPAAADAASDEGAPARAPPPRPPPRPLSLASALPFWFYLAAAVSLVALLLPRISPGSSSPAPLPPLLRGHLASGSVLKLDPAPGLFAVTYRPGGGGPAPRVLILPGLAAGSFSFRRVLSLLSSRGVLAAALDLPGQGLSQAPPAAPAPARTSVLREIMDRGVFHAFEHLVQTGEVPYQEEPAAPPAPSPHAPAEAAAAVARAVEALGVAPVHLVLHDSALAAGAAFASANPGAVRSMTLIDATVALPAFPAAVFDVPVLGRLVLRVPALFRGLVRLCCARGLGAEEAEAHRAAMQGEGRTQGVIEAWKAMNHSFQLGEWRGSSDEVRWLPMMVLWSGSWSDMWIDEGKKVVAALPDAKFVYHSGGRWPQEDVSEEISGLIADFVTSSEEASGGRIE
ncbi:protein AUXIN RESPONSE 4 [Panicum miliaceum]|uniref:Protein AUXIN RESPONSE 4 n=1 Tax=Panicum miliaceum TaxID=4540 RepID=A0A3L6PIF4_PANMI|nr:protein AUXIN RESPONSE 4 [Panicum miliaceum]